MVCRVAEHLSLGRQLYVYFKPYGRLVAHAGFQPSTENRGFATLIRDRLTVLGQGLRKLVGERLEERIVRDRDD